MPVMETTYGYYNEGQLSSGYGSNYAFDYEHRLKAINGQQTTFSYDGAGNRLRAVRNGVETRYIYDAGGNLLAEADGNNVITKYYIHGAGLMAMVTPAGQVYTYHYNAVGSTIAITDSSQNIVNKYAYDEFGNITSQVEAVPQPFKFVGQYGVMTEPNGFYYMRARYYDPKVGRFISEDPIGFDGGDVNLMAYVGNQPLNRIDPDGKLIQSLVAGSISGGISGGVTFLTELAIGNSVKGAFKSAVISGATTGVSIALASTGVGALASGTVAAATNATLQKIIYGNVNATSVAASIIPPSVGSTLLGQTSLKGAQYGLVYGQISKPATIGWTVATSPGRDK